MATVLKPTITLKVTTLPYSIGAGAAMDGSGFAATFAGGDSAVLAIAGKMNATPTAIDRAAWIKLKKTGFDQFVIGTPNSNTDSDYLPASIWQGVLQVSNIYFAGLGQWSTGRLIFSAGSAASPFNLTTVSAVAGSLTPFSPHNAGFANIPSTFNTNVLNTVATVWAVDQGLQAGDPSGPVTPSGNAVFTYEPTGASGNTVIFNPGDIGWDASQFVSDRAFTWHNDATHNYAYVTGNYAGSPPIVPAAPFVMSAPISSINYTPVAVATGDSTIDPWLNTASFRQVPGGYIWAAVLPPLFLFTALFVAIDGSYVQPYEFVAGDTNAAAMLAGSPNAQVAFDDDGVSLYIVDRNWTAGPGLAFLASPQVAPSRVPVMLRTGFPIVLTCGDACSTLFYSGCGPRLYTNL